MAEKKMKEVREPRADAARNYELLLNVAKQAFNEKGSGVRLEEIARTAGVGIGTLYRHFPTREALVQEVYRNEVNRLAAEAAKLIKRHGPTEALRRWLHLFIDYLASKRLLAETLQVRHGDADLIAQTTDVHMGQIVAMLVQKAIKSEKIVGSVEPSDLLRALVGTATIYPDPQWKKNAKRLADVMVTGMSNQ